MSQFKNVLLSNRSSLTPKESINQLVEYALVQDARSRSRILTNAKANWLAAVLLMSFPIGYLINGSVFGCWTAIHPDYKFSYLFGRVGKPQYTQINDVNNLDEIDRIQTRQIKSRQDKMNIIENSQVDITLKNYKYKYIDSYRAMYRPEIYLRDKNQELYKIEQENIETEKRGGQPSVTSPVVLWH